MELIGRQFGHIRVTDVVGEGGMGAVYLGHDEKLDRRVALKVLHADQRLDEEARERLLREARALSRVDHPNICRIHDYIETGDVDLLVLEYIDGRTLQRAIEEGLAHGEKLRIALAVAEVLVRAHRAGIVHRDLKPENVMLTKSGEVKVLDFGLARWFHARRSAAHLSTDPKVPVADAPASATLAMPAVRPSDAFPSGRRELLATAAGITLGTPLYMSPEQARGENLTPASDMFALGLLLQVLFTGKEPHPEVMTAREIILRVARGETNPVEGAPAAIAALINSLKQFAPTDRPTAVEAVDRLKFLIARPQRLLRRAIAAAVIAVMLLGAWRYVVDLDHERSIAIAERAEAQRQKAKAEDLINFMVGDLHKKLEPVGRLDVLDAAAEKALQYVQELRPEAMSVEELSRNAKVLNQVGEVRVGQANYPEALTVFRSAFRLASAAVGRGPRSGEALMTLGASQYWIGHTLHRQGKTEEALQQMLAYQSTAEKLVAADPANREYQLERAYGHGNVASMLEQLGRLPEALPHHLVSLEMKEAVASRAPADPDAQVALAIAHNKVGVVSLRLGDLAAAAEHLEKEAAIFRRLLAGDPRNSTWQRSLAVNLAYQGRVQLNRGNAQQALALYSSGRDINRELGQRDPQNVSWQRGEAMATWSMASVAEKLGDLTRAAALYDEARAKIEAVVKQAPGRASLVTDAAGIDCEYARMLGRAGRRAAALSLLGSVRSRVAGAAPSDRQARIYGGRAELYRGEILAPTDSAQARAAFARAETELAPVVERSSDPTELALWTEVLIHRGRRADARTLIARLQRTGFDTADLQKRCSENGC